MLTWPVSPSYVIVACALFCVSAVDNEEIKSVDVTKLAALTHGTELILLENAYHNNQEYRFEDFFWTGSGDGTSDIDDETYWTSEKPETVYKTKTIISTVYVATPSTYDNQGVTNTTPKCVFNCEGPTNPEGNITPTATYEPNPLNSTVEEEYLDADRQFWLLTILKSDGKDPIIVDLKNSLAKLYKVAFHRQQEKHLGINNNRTKRNSASENAVTVHIHDIAKSPPDGQETIEVLYHVTVAGKPVPAITAAADMKLVSDEEVTNELGFPFIVKAEPYLKDAKPQSLSKGQNTWIFIGISLIALLIILLLITFATVGFTKRKRSPLTAGIDNKRQVFDEEGSGYDNKGYVSHSERKYKRKGEDESPTYINFKHRPSNITLKSGVRLDRTASTSSSSISGSSLDISPLMGLKVQRITPPKKPPRPKAALNKTAPLKTTRENALLDSDSSIGTPDTALMGNSGVVSPKSYLSMPSVKSFPRGAMPEPLNKVLEPVSVLHLDMPDEIYHQREMVTKHPRGLTRHGSMGTVEDPGVIGPIVWNMHCQRLMHGVSVDEGMEDLKVTSNISRMRKRFHDLLDDTFSLFGSRRESPVHNVAPEAEIKSQSAYRNRPAITDTVSHRPRPKTADLRRVVTSPSSEPPKGAWTSHTPSPLIRPLSAGPLQRPITAPTVNVAHVLSEGRFRPSDPAIPLIAAIKSEIEKCSLPGSTTDLRQ